jgi:hypothetical protein
MESTEITARVCTICHRPLIGRQRRFCSRACKNRSTNNRFQNYRAQQSRGRARKTLLIQLCGGVCSRCGYARNLAALTFHHLDPTTKRYPLDLRNLSNRTWRDLLHEASLCVVLCANCHAEEHHPDWVCNFGQTPVRKDEC